MHNSGITQYEKFGDQNDALTLQQLDARLRQEHPGMYYGAVYYNSAREGWKTQLQQRISQLSGSGGE